MKTTRATLRDFHARANSMERDMERLATTRDVWRMSFASEVVRLRKESGIGQAELARQIGCSKGMLHDFEHGRRWSDWIAHELINRLNA